MVCFEGMVVEVVGGQVLEAQQQELTKALEAGMSQEQLVSFLSLKLCERSAVLLSAWEGVRPSVPSVVRSVRNRLRFR